MLAKLFQFTPPCRGRHLRGWIIWILKNFNSRPRVGGDILQGHVVPGGWHISIPAPVWGRRPGCYPCALSQYFNSRPRVGGDRATRRTMAAPRLFQFPPPCGGRLGRAGPPLYRRGISIPAPVWGATRRHRTRPAQIADFNSRPRVGGDTPDWLGIWDIIQFQFTPPCGGRPGCSGPGSGGVYFNSRPRVGGDRAPTRPPTASWAFQFTPPCGGRRGSPASFRESTYFNSRPRVGGDIPSAPSSSSGSISIHAPVWGATVLGLYRSV